MGIVELPGVAAGGYPDKMEMGVGKKERVGNETWAVHYIYIFWGE